MTIYIIFVAIILFLCILADKFSGRFGLPALILFMGIGMLFGCDGLFKIQFSNYTVAEEICTVALSFIMFYGGFNTKWSTAKAIFLSIFAGLKGAASIVISIMIKRAGDTIVPNGDTVICVQDSVILNVPSYELTKADSYFGVCHRLLLVRLYNYLVYLIM